MKERIEWLDVAKGIAIVLVVLGHASMIPERLRQLVFLTHMPFFFVTSGMVYKNKGAIPDIKRLIIPYVVTCGFIVLFRELSLRVGYHVVYESRRQLLKAILYGSGASHDPFAMIGELWFLLALFWAKRILDGITLINDYRAEILGIITFGLAGVYLSVHGIWLPSSIDVAFVGCVFMYAGVLLIKHIDLITNASFLWLMTIVFLADVFCGNCEMAARNYFPWVITIPGALAGSILIMRICMYISKMPELRKSFTWLGRHTLLFLCVHSLDWRLPFRRPGIQLALRFQNTEKFWLADFLTRLIFDCLVTFLVSQLIDFYKKKMLRRDSV